MKLYDVLHKQFVNYSASILSGDVKAEGESFAKLCALFSHTSTDLNYKDPSVVARREEFVGDLERFMHDFNPLTSTDTTGYVDLFLYICQCMLSDLTRGSSKEYSDPENYLKMAASKGNKFAIVVQAQNLGTDQFKVALGLLESTGDFAPALRAMATMHEFKLGAGYDPIKARALRERASKLPCPRLHSDPEFHDLHEAIELLQTVDAAGGGVAATFAAAAGGAGVAASDAVTPR